MTYDEICDVLSLVPELEIWNVDVDTLDATIIVSRNVGGKRLYVKNIIFHEELSSAADPVEYIKGILRRMRVMINNAIRDDMLDCLHYELENLRVARGSDYSGVEAIEMAIKMLEAQEWIPCKKRLPENEYVLISKKPSKISGDKWCVTIAIRMADPRSKKVQWRDIGFGIIPDDKILAWKPLPEPYREDENDWLSVPDREERRGG